VALQTIIETVGEHQREQGQLVSSDDVMDLLRPVIQSDISMETRLDAVMLLEKVGCHQSPSDGQMMAIHLRLDR